jgi:glutaredoxin-related protein
VKSKAFLDEMRECASECAVDTIDKDQCQYEPVILMQDKLNKLRVKQFIKLKDRGTSQEFQRASGEPITRWCGSDPRYKYDIRTSTIWRKCPMLVQVKTKTRALARVVGVLGAPF